MNILVPKSERIRSDRICTPLVVTVCVQNLRGPVGKLLQSPDCFINCFSLFSVSTTTYYKYFISSYSKELRIKLKNFCSAQHNCSLKLSLSAASLPTHSSLSCMAPCERNVSWPQSQSYYYIEVSGTSQSYEVTANHTGQSVVNKYIPSCCLFR
jgi:hypothetical protein